MTKKKTTERLLRAMLEDQTQPIAKVEGKSPNNSSIQEAMVLEMFERIKFIDD
jgi:hypothetical protein